MAFNGSGVFNRLRNFVTDKTNLIPVTASLMDSEMDGLATGLSTCITKDGQTALTAAIPWNSQNLTGVGVLTVTGSTASTSTTTGAAIITGGVGIAGATYVGGALNATASTASTSSTTGAAIISGGLGVGGSIYSGAAVRATSQPCFSAHKNGTQQTGIVSITFTKVTFATEVFDIGSYYDTTLSRWTPPAGMVGISAAILATNVTDGQLCVLTIYKNGVRYKDAVDAPSGSIGLGMTLSIVDRANGTDYYEIFCYLNSPSTGAIDGASYSSHFSGFVF